MANRIPIALFWFFFAFFINLLGNDLHSVWDRDEPRYCQATREMIMTGDFIVPHFNGGLRYDKPPLTYWMMAGPMQVFGINEFAARFPAAASGALRTTIIFCLALAIGCSTAGACLAALAATLATLLLIVSKAATTDSILVLTVVVPMYALWMLRRNGFHWGWWLLFWAGLGVSLLQKGPPGPAIILLAIFLSALWDKRVAADTSIDTALPFAPSIRRTLPHSIFVISAGFIAMLAIALPWAFLVQRATEGDFLFHSILHHVVDRVKEPAEGHDGPFFYYLLTVWPSFYPLTALLLLALPWCWRQRNSIQGRFLLCWLLPGFLMFSIVSTKLPHYIAPLFPALCLMLGLWWTNRSTASIRWEKGLRVTGGVFMILLAVAFLVLSLIAPTVPGLTISALPIAIVGIIAALAGIAGAIYWFRNKDLFAISAWSIGFVATVVLGIIWVLPELNALRASKPTAQWIHDNAPANTRVVAVEYQEPSFVFYWGKGVKMVGRGQRVEGFALLNDVSQPTALVTTAERWRKFRTEYTEKQEGTIHPLVKEEFRKVFYRFEQGKPVEIVIITNW